MTMTHEAYRQKYFEKPYTPASIDGRAVEQMADEMVGTLIALAASGSTGVTYGILAAGVQHPARWIGAILDVIGARCRAIGAPDLTAFAVNAVSMEPLVWPYDKTPAKVRQEATTWVRSMTAHELTSCGLDRRTHQS